MATFLKKKVFPVDTRNTSYRCVLSNINCGPEACGVVVDAHRQLEVMVPLPEKSKYFHFS